VSWQMQAACRGRDPELFFPGSGGSSTFPGRKEREAKAICKGCPVDQECLTFALLHEAEDPAMRYGIYGGLTQGERKSLFGGAPERVAL